MDTDSFELALAEENLDERILPSKRAEWIEKRRKDCRDQFKADAKNNFCLVLAALNKRNMTRENQDCSWRSSDEPKICASVVKTFAVLIVKVQSISLAERTEQTRIRSHWRWPDGNASTSIG